MKQRPFIHLSSSEPAEEQAISKRFGRRWLDSPTPGPQGFSGIIDRPALEGVEKIIWLGCSLLLGEPTECPASERQQI